MIKIQIQVTIIGPVLVVFWSNGPRMFQVKTCVNEPLAKFQSIHSNRDMHDEDVVPSLQFAA